MDTDLAATALPAEPASRVPTARFTEVDPVDALREELAVLEGLPVAERVARFEHANEVLSAALAELDEV